MLIFILWLEYIDLIISSYIVKVIDKNFVIKLCEYFFIFIFWKIDIIVGFIGGK